MSESPARREAEERIIVVGTSCSGKTTLARTLSAALGLEPVELDELYWGPNWTAKPEAEFRRLIAEATAGPRWVVEGNYLAVRDEFWPRASTIIWLNYGLATLLRRALFRTVARLVTRQSLWHGNRESFQRSFLSRESILVWIWTSHRRRSKDLQMMRSRNTYPNLSWVELRDPREARRLAQSYENAA